MRDREETARLTSPDRWFGNSSSTLVTRRETERQRDGEETRERRRDSETERKRPERETERKQRDRYGTIVGSVIRARLWCHGGCHDGEIYIERDTVRRRDRDKNGKMNTGHRDGLFV